MKHAPDDLFSDNAPSLWGIDRRDPANMRAYRPVSVDGWRAGDREPFVRVPVAELMDSGYLGRPVVRRLLLGLWAGMVFGELAGIGVLLHWLRSW